MGLTKASGIVLCIESAPSNTFIDASSKHTTITNTATITAKVSQDLLCAKFNGTTSVLACGNVAPIVNAVMFWMKPASIAVTEEILDLNGTAFMRATNGVISAQGFTSPTISVNGLSGATGITTKWNFVTARTVTAINASDVDIGRLLGSTYYNGLLCKPRLFSYNIPHWYIESVFEAERGMFGV